MIQLWATLNAEWGAPDPAREVVGAGSRVMVFAFRDAVFHDRYVEAIDEWGHYRTMGVDSVTFDVPPDPQTEP